MSAWTCHGFQPLFAHPDLNRPQKGMLGEVLKDQRPERTGFGTASKKGVCRRRVACHGQRLACRCPWTHQSLSMASHTDNGQ
ncbi:unnamed protein product, partial [Mesorhabditis belari]|uniref:Uncharacterized protein n=1 Tax=Mesorhabditis belari TaxID=2138241 RepID=A0AAF3EVS3_9BILA